MDDALDYRDSTVVSGCCGAAAWGEVVDKMGICSACHEHAEFEKSEDED